MDDQSAQPRCRRCGHSVLAELYIENWWIEYDARQHTRRIVRVWRCIILMECTIRLESKERNG